jgi:hypothetical protein
MVSEVLSVSAPASIVERLTGLADTCGRVYFDMGLKLGEKAKILFGPFAEVVGEAEEIGSSGPVKLLFDAICDQGPRYDECGFGTNVALLAFAS